MWLWIRIFSFRSCKSLNKVSNKKLPIIFGPNRKGDLSKVVADINKIKRKIKWKPKFNKLKLIIDSSLKWEKKLKFF